MSKNASKKGERLPDPNQTAFDIAQVLSGDAPADEASEQPAGPALTPDGKNAAAVALGKLGGAKGGKARAAALSPKQRREIAKKAAAARWDKSK